MFPLRLLSAVLLSTLLESAAASILTPSVLPLFVRNPYLSLWLPDARDAPWKKWPMFWTGQSIGFSVMASVPESKTIYPLLGRPHDSLQTDNSHAPYQVSFPIFVGAQFDACTTNLTYKIAAPPSSDSSEDMEIVLSFLSPITPTSTLRQSIPAAYMTVYVQGTFEVDIYTDINGGWVTADEAAADIQSTLYFLGSYEVDDLVNWVISKKEDEEFVERNDRAEWGTIYFTTGDDVTTAMGTPEEVRRDFAKKGTLWGLAASETNTSRTANVHTVYAFAKQVKLSNSYTSEEVRFSMTHLQDPVTQFASARGLTKMRPLWKSYFKYWSNLMFYHRLDFSNARKLANEYSARLTHDATKSGNASYADLVSLSARQVMGATTFSGTPENPLLFLKEISSNGNTQTVDVIFPSFPFFLYTSPRWGAYLLEPLLEHQLSGQYPNDYSMHDLGAHFPNFTGHSDGRDEYMPLEECGDMTIMGLSLVHSLLYSDESTSQSFWAAQGAENYNEASTTDSVFALGSKAGLETRDGVPDLDSRWGGQIQGNKQARNWLKRSWRIWKQWAGYLVEFSLLPTNQLCTDDFAGWLALQTNLALKGIVGIKAMSEMAAILGHDADEKYYRNISDTYIDKWQEYGMSRDGSHAKLAYDWYGSWTTLYSLYADSLLCFHPSITDAYNGMDDHPPEAPPAFNNANGQIPIIPDHKASTDAPSAYSKRKSSDFIPHSIYEKQSKWYLGALQKYGLPLDSRHLYTKSDWELEAAAVTSGPVRAAILERVARWVNETVIDRPLSDLYETEGEGQFAGSQFKARPVVGGHFSFLALERACRG